MKKYGVILIAIFSLSILTTAGKAQGVWKSLAEVSYKISEDQFGELYVPVFSDQIKKLETNQKEINKLEEDLKKSIEEQNFEKSIEIRDQLKKLK